MTKQAATKRDPRGASVASGAIKLDFEISVMCVSRSFTTAMRQVEDHYRSLSHELTLQEWLQRPLGKRYIDNVMRLTSALQ
jgi:cardiolipin synthase A/B